jgi:hypothetical protein
MIDPIECMGNDSPVCPVCGAADDFWHESQPKSREFRDGDEFVNECPKCDTKYKVTYRIKVEFDTEVL